MSENQNSQKRVLALKYRPKRFEDLIGQSTISQTLSLALDSNRLSHAYLFSGLRGSGKTSTARIMAKALLCSNGPTSQPCDVCENCQSSNKNSHLDIIEMDAASNRGIDDIKDLIEHTKYKPSSARFKVFIIDEVHMLTPQAFNALLKTLEEPPGFVKFILATTDPLKLPATILSRTQHFRFKKISNKDVIHHLSHILNEESIDFDTDALEILSRSGQGSLRDTLTLLDQAIIFSKGRINTTAVTDMLGLIDPKFMDDIFDTVLSKGDINPIINRLEEYEAGQVCDEMTIYLKYKMLERSPKFDTLLYDRFFRIIADAKHLLALNADSGFVLILMLSKMIEATNLKTIEEILNEVEKVEVEPARSQVAHSSTPQAVKPQESLSSHSVQPEMASEVQTPKKEENSPFEMPLDAINAYEEYQEEVYYEEEPVVKKAEPLVDANKMTYQKLIDKVYERSHELGECFEKNFIYTAYENGILHITSLAQDEDRKLLYKNFALIRSFVADIFGINTEIEFSKTQSEKKKDEERLNQNAQNNTGSMIEEIEFNESEVGAGCVADMTKSTQMTPAQQELEIEDILNSKMVNKAKELFDIKRIKVKSKS
ncbi:MAG: DNA polymerase III subunit gamma/tau [Candidatus Marinarcus sp.]|uniref:DNA polymerase III subunit gamma/tau n=1 Tax=Candidatus Marinarcus sp. TaxID=3100987 RepID=UPI003AFFBA77